MANLDKQTPGFLEVHSLEGEVYNLVLKGLDKRFVVQENSTNFGDTRVGVLYYHSLDDLSGKQKVRLLPSDSMLDKMVVEFTREDETLARFEVPDTKSSTSEPVMGFWVDLPPDTPSRFNTRATILMDVHGTIIYKLVATELSIGFNFQEGSDFGEHPGVLYYDDVEDLSEDHLAKSYWLPRVSYPSSSRELSVHFTKNNKLTAWFKTKDDPGFFGVFPYTETIGHWEVLSDPNTFSGYNNSAQATIYVDGPRTGICKLTSSTISKKYFAKEGNDNDEHTLIGALRYNDIADLSDINVSEISSRDGHLFVEFTKTQGFSQKGKSIARFESMRDEDLKDFATTYAYGFWTGLSSETFRGTNHTEVVIQEHNSTIFKLTASEISRTYLRAEGLDQENITGVLYYDDLSDLSGTQMNVAQRNAGRLLPEPSSSSFSSDLLVYFIRDDGKFIARLEARDHSGSFTGLYVYRTGSGRWFPPTLFARNAEAILQLDSSWTQFRMLLVSSIARKYIFGDGASREGGSYPGVLYYNDLRDLLGAQSSNVGIYGRLILVEFTKDNVLIARFELPRTIGGVTSRGQLMGEWKEWDDNNTPRS